MEAEEDGVDVEPTAGASFTMRGNFKVFGRAVLALNRIGDELYMEPSDYGLALRSLSCSKSAFGTFLFSKTFFSDCDVSRLGDGCNACRIPMKSALSAFKCVKNSEKAVLSCQLYLNPRADTMRIELTHTYDVVRFYEIPFFDCTTTFRNVVDKANLENCFVIQARLLLEMFNRMHYDTDEILIDSRTDEISFRNYITRDKDKDTVMKTEGKIPIAEFHRYDIKRPAEITVNLKELKAIISFADNYQSPVSVYFDRPGIPMVIALEDDINYTAEVVLATALDDTSAYGMDSGTPVQIVHTSMRQPQKRKNSQISSNLNATENLTPNYSIATKSRVIAPSVLESNNAEQSRNNIDDVIAIIGPPQATSSPLSEPNRKQSDVLPDNQGMEDEDMMVVENEARETSKNNPVNESDEKMDTERPPSHGPALFRYLFAIDEPTFDEEEFFRDAEVLAPDSEPED